MVLVARMLGGLAVVLSCTTILPGIVLGDNPCEDSEKAIARFAGLLPSVTTPVLRQETFEIAKDDNRSTISFIAGGKAVFREQFPVPEHHDLIPTITPIKVEGYTALSFGYSFGAGGGISCSYIMFPALQANGFRSIEVGGRLEDLDADGEAEIVRLEAQDWAYGCPFSRAEMPYWHRILHLSPQMGELIDVSERFPQYYVTHARELQTLSEEVSSRTGLSPACQQGLQGLMKRAEPLATWPRTEASCGDLTTAPQEREPKDPNKTRNRSRG